MTTITTRAGKGSSLSWSEVDSNFTNLNNDKAETTAVALKASIDSPTFTGTPAAPTAAVGTNTTQIATTAFVNSEISNDALLKSGGTATGQIKGITPVAAEDLTRKDYVDTMLPKAGGTMTGVLSATTGLTVKSAATGSNDGNVVSGTYTPTFSNYLNCASTSISGVWSYIRVGDIVTVSGQLSVTPTSGSVLTSFYITLPIASALSSLYQASGHVNARNSGGRVVGDVTGDSSGDRAWASYLQVANTNLMDVVVSFMYQVI